MESTMTHRSSLAVAALVAALTATPSALARVGETLAQCTQRYGPVRATLPSVVAESDPEAARFEFGTLSVMVHFQNGIAWHVSYAQAYLSDPDKLRLLKASVDSGEWEPRHGELLGNVFLWHHRNTRMVACGINGKSLNTLEVMSRPCAEAFGRARTKRIEDAVGQPSLLLKSPAPEAPRQP